MILTTGKVVAPCLLDKTGFTFMNSVLVFTLLEAQKPLERIPRKYLKFGFLLV